MRNLLVHFSYKDIDKILIKKVLQMIKISVINFKNEYYFVKIINNSSVLIEELLTELENLKNLDNTESIHFPTLVLEFETANLKILVTKFVFGKYAKLSNKNIIDLGLAFRNFKLGKYRVNDK